jgi:hypothetical protein
MEIRKDKKNQTEKEEKSVQAPDAENQEELLKKPELKV